MSQRAPKLLLAIFEKDLAYITSKSLTRLGFEVFETPDLDGVPLYMKVKGARVFVLDKMVPGNLDGLDWVEENSEELKEGNVLVLLLSPTPPSLEDRKRERKQGDLFFLPRPSASIKSQESFSRRVARAITLAGRPAPKPQETPTGKKVPNLKRTGLLEYEPQPVPEYGSIADRTFLELFCDVSAQELNGRLLISRDDVSKQIYLLGGYPFYVESNQPEEALDEQIRREGRLDEDRLEVFEDMVHRGQFRVGEILTRNELLTPTGLHALLTENFSRKLEAIFTWEEGEYRFDESDEFGAQDYSFSLSPARLVLDGAMHHVSNEILARCLTIDPLLRPYLRDSELWNDEELSLTNAEFRFVKHLRAHLSVGEILDRADHSEDFATRLFTAFYMLGMIGFEPAPLELKRPAKRNKKRRAPPRGATSRIARSSPPPHHIETAFARLRKLDFFALLDLDHTADQIDIHRAFRAKIKPYHYDVLTKLPLSLRAKGEEVVRFVTEAYLTLVSDDHRELYSADLEDPTLSLEEAARRARLRREGVLISPIPTSPVSSWEMSPPPTSPFPQARLKTPSGQRPISERKLTPVELPKDPEGLLSSPNPAQSLRDAKLALCLGEADQAIAHLKNAQELDPDDPMLLAWHAWALFCSDPQGRVTLAQMNLEAALQADPGLPDVHLLLARIAEYQGDLEIASKRYRFVSLSSTSPAAFRREAEFFENRSLEAWKKGPASGRRVNGSEEREQLLQTWLLNDKRNESR